MHFLPVLSLSVFDIYAWTLIFLILLFPLYSLWIFFNRYYHHKGSHKPKHSAESQEYKNVDVDVFAHGHHQGEHAHHFKEKWYEKRLVTRVIPLTLVFLLLLWLLVAMIRDNNARLNVGPIERLILSQFEEDKQQDADKKEEKPDQKPAEIAYTNPTAPLRFGDTGYIKKLNAADTIAEAEAALQSFLDYYGLDMQLTDIQKTYYEDQGQFKFTRPKDKDLAAIKTYGSMFIDEWAKYPRDFISASKIKSIAFVKGLSVDYGTGHREVSATYDVGSDVMIYDIKYGASNYTEHVVHHEFNHLFEFNVNNTYTRPDPGFTKCNSKAYGSGGAQTYESNSGFSYTEHPSGGFVTTYAQTGIEEDRAELFGYLMQEDNYAKLISWSKTDSCLSKKKEIYKDYIQSLAPSMTDSYYDAIN